MPLQIVISRPHSTGRKSMLDVNLAATVYNALTSVRATRQLISARHSALARHEPKHVSRTPTSPSVIK